MAMSFAEAIHLFTSASVISLGLSEIWMDPRLLKVLICTPDILVMTFLTLQWAADSAFERTSSIASERRFRFVTTPFEKPFAADSE